MTPSSVSLVTVEPTSKLATILVCYNSTIM